MFEQSIDQRAFAAHTTDAPLVAQAFARTCKQMEDTWNSACATWQNSPPPLLQLPFEEDDLVEIEECANAILTRFRHVVILGTGGSSLNGQTWAGLVPTITRPITLHFVDNIDPHTIDILLNYLPLQETAFVAISKSGTTMETLAQWAVFHEAVARVVPKESLSAQLVCVIESLDSPLAHLAKEQGAQIVNHPPIGGRYAGFSVVGLLPACLLGLDIRKCRAGAARMINLHYTEPQGPAIQGAALSYVMLQHGCPTNVMMPYIDRLEPFGRWYRQMWAESLGKQGHGFTPINAMGTVDQHSQLQLYLDGPKDKLFTLISLNAEQQGPSIYWPSLPGTEAGRYLNGHTIGDVLHAEYQATVASLAKQKCPLREWHLPYLNEEMLGALMMQVMLETWLVAKALDINPFDQPAVEDGKQRARQMLENVSYAH